MSSTIASAPAVSKIRAPDVGHRERVAIIGDVGGHLDTLHDALTTLGYQERTLMLPAGLHVIQVGDLIHRGPESDLVVAFVDRLMAVNGTRWTQLVGNHEARYLNTPTFKVSDPVSASTAETLRRWWQSRQMQVATAVTTTGLPPGAANPRGCAHGAGPLLCTHAGLTHGLWSEMGRPDLEVLVDALNRLGRNPRSAIWRSGRMLGSNADLSAGPVWAEATNELVASWATQPFPGFHQAHGHSSLFDWSNGLWRSCLDPAINPTMHPEARIERVDCNGQRIWGVDPGHTEVAAVHWSPLVLECAAPATAASGFHPAQRVRAEPLIESSAMTHSPSHARGPHHSPPRPRPEQTSRRSQPQGLEPAGPLQR